MKRSEHDDSDSLSGPADCLAELLDLFGRPGVPPSLGNREEDPVNTPPAPSAQQSSSAYVAYEAE